MITDSVLWLRQASMILANFTCTLPDMIHLVRGDITVERAIDADRLEVIGPKKLARHLGRWLEISPWSKIEPARREPAVRAE
ncbi:MAG: hypothetical protein LJE67_09675 [Salaquimonas sp.]|nr:hypothetical protein [Salaquimonas sp.]